MRDLPGLALIALGCGLLVSGAIKRRARARPAGAIRPEFAAMGEIVRPVILFAVAFVALKTAVFYFLFDGARFLSPLTFGGFLFVLAAYAAWLVLATQRPTRGTVQTAESQLAGPRPEDAPPAEPRLAESRLAESRLAESRLAGASAAHDLARGGRFASAARE